MRFPVGPERVRLAIEGVAPAMPEGGALVDLGCGGGQLCVHAREARLARGRGRQRAGDDRGGARDAEGLGVELLVAPYDETGLEEGAFDAVTAMGLIEYLPDDDGLFAEAARLLRPGGRFAVSCRNRLYNLQSANRFTARELERGGGRLLEELRESSGDRARPSCTRSRRRSPRGRMSSARRGGRPRRAAARSSSTTGARSGEGGVSTRRASSRRLRRGTGSARRELLALHPHPLPPALERLAPRLYNRLALAWQRPLERSPLGLAFSTAFVAVFERAWC